MADERLKIWETLFKRALDLIDSTAKAGITLDDWSFGGGTVLMRRYRHRFSKDIDIFIPDPQYLNYLSPHLNDTAESMTGDYVLQANFLKLQFPEGEIDFVASAPLTDNPVAIESLFGREDRGDVVLAWIAANEPALRDEFANLEVLEYRRTFDECLAIVKTAFDKA